MKSFETCPECGWAQCSCPSKECDDGFQWYPRHRNPSRAGWYYVREVQVRLRVGIRYFDDSNASWWTVSKDAKNDGALVPNETFHDWLCIPNVSDRQ